MWKVGQILMWAYVIFMVSGKLASGKPLFNDRVFDASAYQSDRGSSEGWAGR